MFLADSQTCTESDPGRCMQPRSSGKTRQDPMLLVFLRAVVVPREGQDQRIVALEFAESRCARVIGQLIVRKNVSGYEGRGD